MFLYPDLAKKGFYSKDVVERFELYRSKLQSPVGAYTGNSKGYAFTQQKISEYISERDQVESDPNKIYMLSGASEGCKMAIQLAIRGPQDILAIPIPQYPLYTAQMTLNSGTVLGYYLDESDNWQLNIPQLEKDILEAKNNKKNVRGLVVINPGNPTGQVLSVQNIRDIIKLCYKHSILIIADEVYSDNVYEKGSEFHSFRKILG